MHTGIVDFAPRLLPSLQPLTFQYLDDSEGDKNRGWQVDEVTAFLGDEKVGYLKLGYIPAARFRRYYPGILNFLRQIEGHSVLPYSQETMPWRKIPAEVLREHIYSMSQLAGHTWTESNIRQEAANSASEDTLRKMVAALEQELKRKKGVFFRRFKSYFVDKPLVEYIHVTPQYRCRGIGTALYRAGYAWMKSKGLPFYASGCQSSEAKLTWEAMKQRYPVEQVREAHPSMRGQMIWRTRFA